jgi:WD40 repeat protein
MLILQAKGTKGPVRWLAFAPDGARLASLGSDHRLRLWPLTPPGPPEVTPVYEPVEHAAFSPDGSWLALLHRSRVSTWRLGQKKEGPRLFGSDVTRRLAVSRDGRFLAAVGGGVSLYDLEARRRRWLWRDGLSIGESVAVSPDGALLASGHKLYDPAERIYFVRLDRLPDGGEPRRLFGPGNTIASLAFRPDGAVLAAACGQFLWTWDVTTGSALYTEKLDARHFAQVAFTPDGRHLAAVRNDATVRFLDARTWQEVRAFDWGLGPLTALAVAPDGMRAAAGSRDGRLVVWDLDL